MTAVSSSRVVLFLVLIITGVLFVPTVSSVAHAQTGTVAKAPYTHTQIVQATNKARLAKDLDKLKVNPKLNFAAQLKANDMVNQNYFGHIAPTGTHYWNFITLAGYPFKSAGENLAFQYTSANAIMKAWLKSAGHRANILGEQYTDVGIGMAYGERNGKKGWYVVELFGSTRYNPIFSLK